MTEQSNPPCEIAPTEAQVQRLLHALRAFGKTRIGQQALWRAFAEACPHRPGGPDERTLLLAALRALELRGALRLPSVRGRRWDRTQAPFVPRSVDVIAETGSRRDDRADSAAGDRASWRTFPWHPHLQWVSDMRSLSRAQVDFLHNVQRGLSRGWFQQLAPIKYRSLQLTGDEKRLARLATTQIFSSGRLDFELLACFPDHPPLAWEPIAPTGEALLIFENAGAFMLARQLLQTLDEPPYHLLAYGSGRTLPAGLPHLQTIGRSIATIHYVGDLDPLGLEIALLANERATRLGLPPVAPAPGWHTGMLDAAAELGHPEGWPSSKSHVVSRPLDELLAFLPEAARERANAVLVANHRIPEEVLGPGEMTALLASARPTR